MKTGHIFLLVILPVVAVLAWYERNRIKSWFAKDTPSVSNEMEAEDSKDDEDEYADSVDCNRDDINRWVYLIDIATAQKKFSNVEDKVQEIFAKANSYFSGNMKWVGNKKGKIVFEISSKGAKNIIDLGIAAAGIQYQMHCFRDKKTSLFG